VTASYRRRFAAQERSVPAARRFVVAAMGEVADDVRDVVAVMISELATNALLHAVTDFVVEVDISTAVDEVRVAVHDGGDGQPVVQDPDPTDTHGRGLRIVASLADRWGTGPSDQEPGTVVWFVVRRAGRAGDDLRRSGGRAEETVPCDTPKSGRPRSVGRRQGHGARASLCRTYARFR